MRKLKLFPIKLSLALFCGMLLISAAASKQDVENVTVSLSFNPSEVYVDGEKVSEGVFKDFDFPYIASSQPTGIIGENVLAIRYNSYDGGKMFEVTQRSSNFLVPHTDGGIATIEDERIEFLRDNFLKQTEPSFQSLEFQESLVKVIFRPDIKLESDTEDFNSGSIGIVNLGNGRVALRRK